MTGGSALDTAQSHSEVHADAGCAPLMYMGIGACFVIAPESVLSVVQPANLRGSLVGGRS